MRLAQTSCLLFIVLLFVACLTVPSARAQQVSTSWNGGTGNWSGAANWTPTGVPNNGGGATYGVTIDTSASVPSSTVTMDVLNDTIDTLTLGNSFNGVNTLIINAGDSLTVLGELETIGPESTGPFTPYSQLINNGTLTVDGGVFHSGILTNAGVFVSPGTFISEGPVTNTAGAFFINDGNFFNTSLGAPFNNAGSFINTSGADYFTHGSTFTNATGASIINSGTFNVNDSEFNNHGVVINNGVFVLSTTDSYNGGTLFNTGMLTNGGSPGSTLTNAGTIINSGGTLSNDSLSTIINSGTLLNISGANLTNAGTLNNSGTFTNSGAVTITSSGLFTTSTNYTQTGGSTLVDGTLTATGSSIVNIQGGTLGGTGTINGNVLMGGTLMPGDAPGTLTILGNYEQTGVGIFDEIISAQSQSFLDVSGIVTLDPGSLLEITLFNGYDPLNQTFSIMDFASLNGQFANGASFWDDGFLWDITYFQHEVEVTAVEAPEPSSLLLLFFGLAALASLAHRKMRESRRLA